MALWMHYVGQLRTFSCNADEKEISGKERNSITIATRCHQARLFPFFTGLCGLSTINKKQIEHSVPGPSCSYQVCTIVPTKDLGHIKQDTLRYGYIITNHTAQDSPCAPVNRSCDTCITSDRLRSKVLARPITTEKV